MRTTVTLDADVEQAIRETMQRGRQSFKQTLNDAIRRGLKGNASSEPPFVVRARALGLRPGIDSVQIRELDDDLEVDEFLRKSAALERALE